MTTLHHFGVLKGQVKLDNIFERVMLPHVVMRCVHRNDYDTTANAESPTYAWPDAIHDGVVLDDEKSLQMFETYVSTNPELCAYDCRIASQGRHPKYKRVANTFVYGSWRFHHYFDGLKVMHFL
jgi:hypothetical protein